VVGALLGVYFLGERDDAAVEGFGVHDFFVIVDFADLAS
jgi:hypothetical protein